MPYVHTDVVSVRHYECDFYGRLYLAALLGYMQEAAFAASAAVGYSARRYAEIGLQWLAYETEIEMLNAPERPLGYGDALTIKTWVVDFRRVRSLRRYEIFCDAKMVARASTDWVLMDMNTRYPASIPPEIVTAYAHGEDMSTVAEVPRLPFPRFPAMPDDAYHHRRRVEWRDLDPAQHVNNAVYVHYAAEAERQALAASGRTFEQVVPRRWQIEYKLAAVLDDEVDVATWTDTTAENTRYCALTRAVDGKLLARIRSEFVIRL